MDRLANIEASFAAIDERGTLCSIDRSGRPLFPGGHFQGIQLAGSGPERAYITSSSNEKAYLVVADLAASGGRVAEVICLDDYPWNHAGGFQIVGDILAVGIENAAQDASEVRFYELAPEGLRLLEGPTVRRAGRGHASTAGAVGLAPLEGGWLLAAGSWDCRTIDFYSLVGDIHASRFSFRETWAWDEACREGWLDEEFPSYQTINLLTQADGGIYLVGFARAGEAECMDLYRVELEAARARILVKVGRKRMRCEGGCSFSKAAGIVASSGGLEAIAAKGTSGHHASGREITMQRFRAAGPA
ncbi:MAG TPA: hypothetical protein PLB91_05510 [Spirochaetales bacterium]|nr:hypothetical protein [Spirochaetales bacterium]HRZ65275.1 hypothetical protein [Spirochaetia bacterium]